MVCWEGGRCICKNGQEVVFESVYGAFSGISAMDMWWYELEGASICGDGLSEGKIGFIIQDVQHGLTVGLG